MKRNTTTEAGRGKRKVNLIIHLSTRRRFRNVVTSGKSIRDRLVVGFVKSDPCLFTMNGWSQRLVHQVLEAHNRQFNQRSDSYT